jgi:hypothetical protein
VNVFDELNQKIKGKKPVEIAEILLDAIEAQQQEIERLKGVIKADIGIIEGERLENEQVKAQNKMMFEALMCLPGAMGATVTQEVCKICLRRGECEECLLDKAIREAMER